MLFQVEIDVELKYLVSCVGFDCWFGASDLVRGFVGVGVGHQGNQDTIRVYVSDARFPLVKKLSNDAEFEGFPLEIQTVGRVESLPTKNF